MPASHARDGRATGPGQFYRAPPDHHLLVEAGHFAVRQGPEENRHRPATDVLFRSAGYGAGPGVVGVVLPGL
ncbi:chemotaxis protein CheB [Deinococcus petrolearius]|uniref:protein-glutamate methylesterase n=1 Tax=Deinococcus petrolearius TaxID=1751295 RepID=A0ABW1DQ42_9DEIO